MAAVRRENTDNDRSFSDDESTPLNNDIYNGR
jgi:hypothetical protein